MADVWEWLPTRYRYLELDRYVVTPNHLRGIIIISNGPKDQSRTAQIPARKPLGRLIGAFKSVATKKVNPAQRTPNQRSWQRNYYEHVIRSESELNRVREYILDNPQRWETDSETRKPSAIINSCRESSDPPPRCDRIHVIVTKSRPEFRRSNND